MEADRHTNDLSVPETRGVLAEVGDSEEDDDVESFRAAVDRSKEVGMTVSVRVVEVEITWRLFVSGLYGVFRKDPVDTSSNGEFRVGTKNCQMNRAVRNMVKENQSALLMLETRR